MHLHDLRHLLHDKHLLHAVFSTLLGHPSARPGLHLLSVALELLLLLPPHLHRVLFLHHVVNFSDTLLSSVLSHPSTWRVQLRVVCGNLQSVLEVAFPPRDVGTQGVPHASTICVSCYVTSIFCTAFPRRLDDAHWSAHSCAIGPGPSCGLLSSGLSPRPSWRFQLRVVHGILRNVLCARFPSAKDWHPRNPCVNPCFMMSALLMYRRRVFPNASSTAIAAGALTSGSTTRTSFALLGPSQGLAVTVFRKVRSTRSVASRRRSPSGEAAAARRASQAGSLSDALSGPVVSHVFRPQHHQRARRVPHDCGPCGGAG